MITFLYIAAALAVVPLLVGGYAVSVRTGWPETILGYGFLFGSAYFFLLGCLYEVLA